MGNSRSAREDLAGGIYGFDIVARTRRATRLKRCWPRLQLVHGRLRHARAARRQGAAGPIGVNKFWQLIAIEKIKNGQMTGVEAAAHFERVVGTHRLRETGHYDPKLVDILVTRVRHTKEM
jgi:hypothetical protein